MTKNAQFFMKALFTLGRDDIESMKGHVTEGFIYNTIRSIYFLFAEKQGLVKDVDLERSHV